MDMGLGHGNTQWKARKLMHLDWIQSKMSRSINGFYPKHSDRLRHLELLKLRHGEDERSTRNLCCCARVVLRLLDEDMALCH